MRRCEVRNTNSGNLLTTFFGLNPPHGAFTPVGHRNRVATFGNLMWLDGGRIIQPIVERRPPPT
jgi:hypothetical protein